MDLWVREARLFKMGSGTGSNFSNIRAEGEQLAGGGKSSGLMSFLKIGDRAAGAIKSGGTTRRAAKMVILDVDHPDIEGFIAWKRVEEQKARLLIEHGGFPADFNGEAYITVSGQNSNNSVRVDNRFIQAVLDDDDWDLINRVEGDISKTVKAADIWQQIAEAAWACADPGMQYHSTITSGTPARRAGRYGPPTRARSTCSSTTRPATWPASTWSPSWDRETGKFDIEGYLHAIRIWTIVLEISVTMAHFPSKPIASGSFDYRTLGLGYANLGSLLMRSGDPLRLREGSGHRRCPHRHPDRRGLRPPRRGWPPFAGPFPRFHENREHMLRVMRNHRRAAYGAIDYEGVTAQVLGIDPDLCPPHLLSAARSAWDRALSLGERHGYRNAQATVLAPTGTIGLVMDCDTTGVEPDFALVKFKKLAGGGYFKIANQSVAPALRRLGYSPGQIQDILSHVVGTSSLMGAPHINRETLAQRGFTSGDLARVNRALPGAFELGYALNAFVLGDDALRRLGFSEEDYTAAGFGLLSELGFQRGTDHTSQRLHLRAPDHRRCSHLREEHLPVFDCANRNGKYGKRFIHHTGHIKSWPPPSRSSPGLSRRR